MKKENKIFALVLPKDLLRKLEIQRERTGIGVGTFIRSLVMKWDEDREALNEKRN